MKIISHFPILSVLFSEIPTGIVLLAGMRVFGDYE